MPVVHWPLSVVCCIDACSSLLVLRCLPPGVWDLCLIVGYSLWFVVCLLCDVCCLFVVVCCVFTSLLVFVC